MRLNEMTFSDVMPIEGYGPGFFRLGTERHDGPLLVTGGAPRVWGGLEDRATLLALAGEVDVIFFGMGADIAFLPADLREALEEAGLGAEVMASPAACRTYNVLLNEGRRIALAALPV